jgi:hypothetical protein
VKTRLLKEGINRINNKEAYKLILYIYSNRLLNINQKSSYKVGKKYMYYYILCKDKRKRTSVL